MPWWFFILLLSVGGWLLINAAYSGYDLYGEMIMGTLPESQAVESTRQSMSHDVATTLALYFGWGYLPLMAFLLLPVYMLADYLRYRKQTVSDE